MAANRRSARSNLAASATSVVGLFLFLSACRAVGGSSTFVTPASSDITAASSDVTPAISDVTPVSSDVTPAYADATPGKVFSRGRYAVKRGAFLLKKRRFLLKKNPPKPLRIWAPATGSATALPVLVFQHGFSSQNSFYSQLLTRIASHGFIVVAPQMYPLTTGYNTAPEMRGAADVIGWLRKRLAPVLKNRLRVKAIPDWDKFAISGHSRGGKVAFGVARALVKASPVTINAVVLLDPVDGASNKTKNTPATLTHSPDSITLTSPVLVIGAGLGPIPSQKGGMPCAPAYFGHQFFYSDLASSAYHVVMPKYGHADFNNNMKLPFEVCPGGNQKVKARRAAAGLMVAFLRAKLDGDSSDLDYIWANPGHAPVAFSPLQSK